MENIGCIRLIKSHYQSILLSLVIQNTGNRLTMLVSCTLLTHLTLKIINVLDQILCSELFYYVSSSILYYHIFCMLQNPATVLV